MFIEEIDPVTGEVRWKVADDDYDLAQEIARSRFGDMLHDIDRNHLYQAGLHSVIQEMHKKNESVHVIDIGTGTGLLSMMAIQAGAEKVTAIEAFKPMADCAEKIFEASGFKDRITLIKSRSTDLIPWNEAERGNCIVAEVFDTELIGEGALRTFKEAHKTIARPFCRVIPSSGRIWIVPVQSSFLRQFHSLPNKSLSCPFPDCLGSAAVFDVQLSNISHNNFELLCEPFQAFVFDFEHGASIKYDEMEIHSFTVESKVADFLDAILMWWDLDMDGSGRFILSTAPKWWNPYAQWRDHWMQGVYYLPKSLPVRYGQSVSLRCHHDEVSLWFDLDDNKLDQLRPYCTCGVHATCSRNAVYRLNQIEEDKQLNERLKKVCCGKTVVAINSGSFIGLLAAKYAKFVTIIEYNNHFRAVLAKYSVANGLKNLRFFANETELEADSLIHVDLVLSEPYFFSSLLPWDNLRIWYTCQRLESALGTAKAIPIFPCKFMLYAMPVHFEDLWKIVAPVGVVEGFDLSPFDKICQKARSATDDIIEPHPLWEYSSTCAGDINTIVSVTCEKGQIFCVENPRVLKFRPRTANAIVLWGEWWYDEYKRSNGPIGNPTLGDRLKWSIGERQGVYFLPEEKRLDLMCNSVTATAKVNLASQTLSYSGEILKISFNFSQKNFQPNDNNTIPSSNENIQFLENNTDVLLPDV